MWPKFSYVRVEGLFGAYFFNLSTINRTENIREKINEVIFSRSRTHSHITGGRLDTDSALMPWKAKRNRHRTIKKAKTILYLERGTKEIYKPLNISCSCKRNMGKYVRYFWLPKWCPLLKRKGSYFFSNQNNVFRFGFFGSGLNQKIKNTLKKM